MMKPNSQGNDGVVNEKGPHRSIHLTIRSLVSRTVQDSYGSRTSIFLTKIRGTVKTKVKGNSEAAWVTPMAIM